jgi:hypothetical protein
MRNLSPLGAIPSPIDADRDAKAYSSDWKALGLSDHSPFAILSRPRAETLPSTAPRKRVPKPSATQRVIASLRDLPTPGRFCTDIPSREESDRTTAIAGRGLA